MSLKKPALSSKALAPQNIIRISEMSAQNNERHPVPDKAWRWRKHQVCRADKFSLVTVEGRSAGTGGITHTSQEDYIKVNFLLSGKRTTVLQGFGQYEHDRPLVFITSGPLDMIKVDLLQPDTPVAQVCLYMRRGFFPSHLGLALEELPEPLRSIVIPEEMPFALHGISFTPSLAAATRAVLSAPAAVRQAPAYAQAKAVELMYLLINRMASDQRKSFQGDNENDNVPERWKSRLYDARELLCRDYVKALTLEGLSKEVGLSKAALSNGFRRLFGMSVHDCLHKERMEHAYDLLQDRSYTIGQVAESVGYSHACNFSTAFRAFYGCTPQKIRAERHSSAC